MAKVKVLKSFAYADKDGVKITVRKPKSGESDKIVELTGDNLKHFKKCKAVEPAED